MKNFDLQSQRIHVHVDSVQRSLALWIQRNVPSLADQLFPNSPGHIEMTAIVMHGEFDPNSSRDLPTEPELKLVETTSPESIVGSVLTQRQGRGQRGPLQLKWPSYWLLAVYF